ncbi:SpoIIE family protein phosphatase [Pseudomonas sp. LRF_L74]|uniref:SpoIIE family protein phosphatase n=1 Tax=Pseudomonas sp. LRF_L74 TaxID=3369422 RepID=UPI003F5FDD5C
MFALLLLVFVVAAGVARHLMLQEATSEIRNEAQASAKRIDDILRVIAITCDGISDAVTKSGLAPEQLLPILRAMVGGTPGATGALLVVDDVAGTGKPFALRLSVEGKDRDFIATGYDYRAQSWYRRTLSAPSGWWSEPYFSEVAGGEWIITYNKPIRFAGRGGSTLGMVSIDLKLESLEAQLGKASGQAHLSFALIAPDGLIAVHPENGVALRHDIASYIAETGRGDLEPAAAATRLRQPLAYLHEDIATGTRYFTAVEPVGDTGSSIVASQAYADILQRVNLILLLLAGGVLLAALCCTLAILWLAHRVSRPVEDLVGSAIHLGGGDYDRPVPHGERSDEVGHLARTLDQTRMSIQQQLVEIREMAGARQKLESELAIARDIQLAMLPPPRTLTNAGRCLEAYARLEPAKAVGGDFYSFIERDGMLWFSIGDVSDKGIPAALFMARTVTALDIAVSAAATPNQALTTASRQLVEGNDACMFATVLCGYVKPDSGDCVLASAGHDQPLLLRANGSIERLAFDGGPPLGIDIVDGLILWRGRLAPGDSLVAWTDGITEAFNAEGEAFGDERLLDALRPGDSAPENCTRLFDEVRRFAEGAPQSDDITVMILSMQDVS